MLTRSENNEDTKGLWLEELLDLDYATMESRIVLKKGEKH